MAAAPASAPEVMPERSLVLSTLERLHVHKALTLYVKSLERSRANEINGSDIHRFRSADISMATAILNRLA